MLEIVARIGDSIIEVSEGPRRAHDGTPLVAPGIVTVGVVTYTITTTQRSAERVPRHRIDRRPLAYFAASLIVQLAIWLVAVTTAPFERLHHASVRITHVTHVHAPDPPPPPKLAPPRPAPPQPTAPPAATGLAHHREALPHASTPPPQTPAEHMAHLAKAFDDLHVAEQLAATNGPLVDENTDDPNAFGAGHSFNPDNTTYKVERWAFPTFTRSYKGQLAPVPAIEWCDDDSCLTRGPLPIDRVLAILARHEKQIAQCYREHTGDLVGNVRVRFPVGTDGRVTGTLGTETGPVGSGTGTVGRCIAKIAQGIRFPQAEDETYVFVGLAFRPASG